MTDESDESDVPDPGQTVDWYDVLARLREKVDALESLEHSNPHQRRKLKNLRRQMKDLEERLEEDDDQ